MCDETKLIFDLDDWAVVVLSPYSAPEEGRHLSGKVRNHTYRPDGERITTSRIMDVCGNVVTTESGSYYRIHTPSQEYIDYCEKQGWANPIENGITIRKKQCTPD